MRPSDRGRLHRLPRGGPGDISAPWELQAPNRSGTGLQPGPDMAPPGPPQGLRQSTAEACPVGPMGCPAECFPAIAVARPTGPSTPAGLAPSRGTRRMELRGRGSGTALRQSADAQAVRSAPIQRAPPGAPCLDQGRTGVCGIHAWDIPGCEARGDSNPGLRRRIAVP
jgi:hypothetical protein